MQVFDGVIHNVRGSPFDGGINNNSNSPLYHHTIDYVEGMRDFYGTIDNLLAGNKSLEPGMYKEAVGQLDAIFYSLCNEEDIAGVLNGLGHDEKNQFMLTLVKGHKLLTEYDNYNTMQKEQRQKVLENLDFETMVFEKEDAINLHNYIRPLLMSRAKNEVSIGNRGSAIKANEKLLYLYSNLDRTPEVLRRAGQAASYLAKLYFYEDVEKSEFYSEYELGKFKNLKGLINEKERLEHIAYASARLGTLSWPHDEKKAKKNFYRALDAVDEMGRSAGPKIIEIAMVSHEMLGKYHRKRSPKSALYHYCETIKLANGISDITDDQLLMQAKCHSDIGDIYSDKSNFIEFDPGKAIDHKASAVSLMEKIHHIDENVKNCWIMSDCMTIAKMSHNKGDNEKDRNYIMKAKEVGDVLFITGSDFKSDKYKCYVEALQYYELATHWLGLTEDNMRAKELMRIYKEEHESPILPGCGALDQ